MAPWLIVVVLLLATATPVGAARTSSSFSPTTSARTRALDAARPRHAGGRRSRFQESFRDDTASAKSQPGELVDGAVCPSPWRLRQPAAARGASQFDARSTIATVLQNAGYATAYFGKYLNAYEPRVRRPYTRRGWGTVAGLREDEPRAVLRIPVFLERGRRRSGRVGDEPSDYSTDLLLERHLRFHPRPTRSRPLLRRGSHGGAAYPGARGAPPRRRLQGPARSSARRAFG
jgi:hypothetical protein